MDTQRPTGFRFAAGGVNLRNVPDAMQPNKYSCAWNIRWLSDQSAQTRPGWSQWFQSGVGSIPFTDLRSYAAIETDDKPRLLGRDQENNIVLDTGVRIGTLAGAAGYGVSMLPFRPASSPQTWMYISSLGDYQKFSAPDANNAVTQYKVGIAEPQVTAQAAVVGLEYRVLSGIYGDSAKWTGTGSAASNSATEINIVTDTTSVTKADPVNANRYSVSVASGSLSGYQVGALVCIGGRANLMPIYELRPDIGSANITGTLRDYVWDGTQISQISVDATMPTLDHDSMMTISGNTTYTEAVLVQDAIRGPGGESFTCLADPTNIISSGALIGVPVFIVEDLFGSPLNANGGESITIDAVGMDLGSPQGSDVLATGGMYMTFAASPFRGFGPDDYVNVIITLETTTGLQEVDIDFDLEQRVGATPPPPTFTNTLSYSFTGDSLAATFIGPTAALKIPISSFTGSAGDLTGCGAVRIQAVTAGAQTLTVHSFWIGGGNNPDVGADGVPYQYRYVPRGGQTGATGNPSPVMRYGVNPRRQTVQVNLPTSLYDPQIGSWDIYRYGGSVTSYRYIGSAAAGASLFVDNVSDAAATAGQPLETDNFEPWLSIDVPYTPGTYLDVQMVGSIVQITGGGIPADIINWCPGTLIQVAGAAYTLRTRPISIAGGWYQMEVEESGGKVSSNTFAVGEPLIANSKVPYTWGPDEQGAVFAVGDPLRPGTLYYSKAYAPDSAPDTDTIELCPPSEPLIGGRAINGVSYVASTKRWWALYPSFSQTSNYSPVSQPVGRPLISPWGIADDGTQMYFWTTDGIVASAGNAYQSLTNDDLYPLFPHEGVNGVNITRNGRTFYAPDYGQAARFRLAHFNGYLYADYVDTLGNYRTLVCDLRFKAWTGEDFGSAGDEMTVHYGVEQQAGTLLSGATRYQTVVMADELGKVYQQAGGTGDAGDVIKVTLATFQWDGGDLRAKAQWGDLYLDCAPISQITATPCYHDGSTGPAMPVGPVTTGSPRGFVDISLAGGVFQKFVGLQLDWTDYAASQSMPTTVYIWQPSIIPQPDISTDRYTDWMAGAGTAGAFYFRGMVLVADTFNAAKQLLFRNGDTLNQAALLTVTHNGEQAVGYSFVPPFVSHLVRIEPQSSLVAWKVWPSQIQWIGDPWPELTTAVSAWMNLGTAKCKYLRGVTLPIDTNGAPVTIIMASSDGPTFTFPAVTTTAGEKSPTPFAITVPFIGHEFQLQPQQPCRMWPEEAVWDFEVWPELITETGPWLNLGTNKNKYMRAMVLPLDTGGQSVTMSFRSSDGASRTITASTTAAVKSPTPFAFQVPLVGHEFQIYSPSSPVRIWFEEAQYDFEEWPELITESGPYFDLGTRKNKYLRALVLPMDTGGQSVSMTLATAAGATLALGPVSTIANTKTPVPFAWPVPFIGHEFQILNPSSPVRIWFNEIQFDFEEWPEFITESGPWLNLGTNKNKYMRGVVVPLDTGGVSVSMTLRSSDGYSVVLGPVTTSQNVKSPTPFAWSVPLIGHEFQIVSPSGPVRIWFDEAQYDFEEWPELITESGPWLNLGTNKNKYMRGMVIPIDTGGAAVSMTMVSSDGASITLGPVTTTANVKSPRPFAFAIPLIGHEFQIRNPTGPIRIWFNEGQYDFDEWPELITEATGWLTLNNGAACFLQGLTIPIETNGQPPQLELLTDTGQTITLVTNVVPLANVKTVVAFSLSPPVVAHVVQIVPLSPCRIWTSEVKFVCEPTPEQATTWTSQWTANGLDAIGGYMHVARIEAAYSSTAPVTLTINVYDGIAPQVVTLPSTGGQMQKHLITLTLNKGLLYQYSVTSSSYIQVFSNLWIIWVGSWSRTGPYTAYQNLGSLAGAGVTI